MAAIRVAHIRYEEISTIDVREAVRACGMSARGLSVAAGFSNDQFVSRLERGLIKNVTREQFQALAEAMAGNGAFKDQDAEMVKKVMRGQASFTLRLVEDQPKDEAWVARESNPEPTDWSSAALEIGLVA